MKHPGAMTDQEWRAFQREEPARAAAFLEQLRQAAAGEAGKPGTAPAGPLGNPTKKPSIHIADQLDMTF